jgi:hypothetical protein
VLTRYADQLGVPVEEAAHVLHVLVLGAAVQPDSAFADPRLLARTFVSGVGS